MASQHNSTTHIDKAQGAIIAFIANRGHKTHHTEHTSNQAEALHVWVQPSINEKGWKPDYLQHPIKIVAEVLATSRSP